MLYFVEILAEIDKAVKTIVDALKKQGFWDNTLTIFTAGLPLLNIYRKFHYCIYNDMII